MIAAFGLKVTTSLLTVAELADAQLSVIVTLSILWVTVGGTPLVLPSSLIFSTTLMPEVT